MSSIQLSEPNFTRRLAMLASLHLPDSLVEETIKRFIKNNSVSVSKQPVPSDLHVPEKRGAVAPTGIKKAIRKAIATIEGEFSYREVQQSLHQSGYRLEAKSPASSIGRVLRKLTAEGILAESRKGSGNEPSVFRKVHGSSRASAH